MAASRLTDPLAGAADPRMAPYLEGRHHPQQALPPRNGYVAVDGDRVVGYIAGHLTRRFACDGEVQYLYVAPDHRRSGIASELVRLQLHWFRQQNARRICVNVDVESPAAAPFYLSRGAAPLSEYWYLWEDIDASPGK